MSDYSAIPFPDELVHLEQVSARFLKSPAKGRGICQQGGQEYTDTKKYMADHRGEIDPHEMFQNELLLKQTDRTGAFAVEMRDRIVKLKDSPILPELILRRKRRKDSRTISGDLPFNMKMNR